MFNFLKPKRDLSEQSQAFATSTLKLWAQPGPRTQLDIDRLVEMGCDRDRLCVEMTAFTVFSTWYGIRLAYAQGNLEEHLYKRLESSYLGQLRLLTENEPLAKYVSISYDSLGDLLFARLDHYLSLNSSGTASEGRDKAIDYLCDFICNGEPSSELKFYLISFLNLASFKVFDTLGTIRLQ